MPESVRHRILLLGNPASRPEGLEHVLVRGGFEVAETPTGQTPDLLLYTPDASSAGIAEEVRALVTQSPGSPVVVLLGAGRTTAATDALLAGASDVLVAPIHLPELRARLDVHMRAAPRCGKQRRRCEPGICCSTSSRKCRRQCGRMRSFKPWCDGWGRRSGCRTARLS